MEERKWRRPLDEPMRFAVRASSRERGWTGIEATLCETSGGLVRSTPSAYHCLSMHVSGPIHASCRFEGSPKHRLQIAGDIDLLPAGSSASWHDEGETTMLIVRLHPSLVHAVAESMGIGRSAVSIPPQLQLRDPHLQHIGWALKAELEADEPFGRVYAESLGVALASHLLRRYAHPAAVPTKLALSKRRLTDVLDYIHDHLSQDLSLTELAGVASLSPSHFKVFFRQSMGMPVHQYIIRQRVDYAVALIAQGKLPLCDVAIQAGFSNQSHMARYIRRFMGTSPGALREGRVYPD